MPFASSNKIENGFTLIEISIVLVIIGLIVGGILTGEDLIKVARVNTIISERTQYLTAAYAFRGKYGAMPGDFSNAVGMIAPAAGGNTSDNYTLTCYGNKVYTGTCNGNGDGTIGYPASQQGGQGWASINGGNQSSGEAPETEGLLFWNQMAFAGMIAGKYMPAFRPTGTPVDDGYGNGPEEYPGFNIPGSRAYSNAAWSLWNIYVQPVDTTLGLSNNNTSGHMLFYGAATTSTNANYDDTPLYPILTPLQAQSIDRKIDDGKAMTGKVQAALKGSDFTPSCTTTNDPTTSQYDLSNTGILCSLYFMVF
ncbi:MAG TPA: prepilin-type N-terminal cleavage/methylation domain-containing protein [Rickettsiales bacterium]|nr:prepilin-type N-terminal cleavage/methylation domain-containing protein [Rickettsiales bacterium]